MRQPTVESPACAQWTRYSDVSGSQSRCPSGLPRCLADDKRAWVQLLVTDLFFLLRPPPAFARLLVGLLSRSWTRSTTALDADFLAVNTSLAARRFIRRAHANGKDVYVWTVNDPVQMFRVMNLGVDGIITDQPGRAGKVLQRRAELSAAERRLVGIATLFGAAEPDPPASNDVG